MRCPLSVIVFAMSVSAPIAAGHACGNVVRVSQSDEVRALVKAERQIAARQHAKAIHTLMGVYRYGPMSNRMKLMSSSPKLVRRARRIAALAAVRTRGTRSLQFWNQTVSAAPQIKRQLEWARAQLKAALKRAKDDPQRKSQLAEAQALLGERAAARQTLEALATADLLIDAEAWALLAELRAEAGDAPGAQTARGRCAAVAPDAPFCRPTT